MTTTPAFQVPSRSTAYPFLHWETQEDVIVEVNIIGLGVTGFARNNIALNLIAQAPICIGVLD